MYIGVVPIIEQVHVEAFEIEDWWRYILILVTLIVSLGLTAICVFQTSHSVIKPLRQLNSRMREILESDTLNEVSLGNEQDTCKEIN